jgi:ABC-type cobalamin/Fe3+-siderophores transport system ATPase subunit
MSLPHLLTGLVDQYGETMQQAAMLAYLRQGEEAQPALEVRTLIKMGRL